MTTLEDDSDEQVSRRVVLKGLGALGIGNTTFQRALAAQVVQKNPGAVTSEMIKQAEWIAGLELTDGERARHRRVLHSDPRVRSPSSARCRGGLRGPAGPELSSPRGLAAAGRPQRNQASPTESTPPSGPTPTRSSPSCPSPSYRSPDPVAGSSARPS